MAARLRAQVQGRKRPRAPRGSRALPALAAGLIALSGSVVMAGAAPSSRPHGLARGHEHLMQLATPVGPGDDGSEHAAVSVPHGAPAAAPPAQANGNGNDRRDGDEDVESAVASAGLFDLSPRHFTLRVAIAARSGSSVGATPAGATVTALPLTGVAPPPASSRRTTPQAAGAAPRRIPAGPVFPNLPLIPPASLPSPAPFVPTPAGFSLAPVIGLVVCLVALGALLGIRIARRPG